MATCSHVTVTATSFNIFIVLLLVSISASSQDSSTLGDVASSGYLQDNFRYVIVKDNLQLNCSLSEPTSLGANELVFYLDNDTCGDDFCKLNSSKMVDGKLQLNHLVTGKENAGTYMCFLKTSNGIHLVDSQEIKVQYGLKEVKNISCTAYDWGDSLKCHWDLDVKYIQHEFIDVTTDVELLIPENIRVAREPCPDTAHPPEGPTTECFWDKQHFYSPSRFVLTVVVKNNITNKKMPTNHLLHLDHIVKPSSVQHIWEEDKNSSCVRVAWNHTRNYRSKVYKIYWTIGAQNYSKLVNDSKTWVCGLSSYMTYTFSIKTRPVAVNGSQHGLWSEAAAANFTTSQSVPSSSFGIHRGSYFLHPCDKSGRRNVTIFFKDVPQSQRNGEIIGYRLSYSGLQQDVDVRSPTSATLHNVVCGSDLNPVRIFSRTKAGASLTNARIGVFDKQAAVENFAVDVTSEARLRAVWKGIKSGNTSISPADTDTDHKDEATVFWCLRGADELHMCKKEIEWNTTTFTAGEMDIPRQQLIPEDYLFGISLNGQGITWASCQFNLNEKMKAPESVTAIGTLPGAMFIRWVPQSCSADNPVQVTHYLVRFCQTDRCNETAGVERVEGGKQFELKMGGLEAVRYTTTVQAVDSEGRQGPLSQPVLTDLHGEEDGHSFDVYATIGGIVAFIVVLIIVGLMCRRKYKRDKDKFSKKMDCPDFGGVMPVQEEEEEVDTFSKTGVRQASVTSYSGDNGSEAPLLPMERGHLGPYVPHSRVSEDVCLEVVVSRETGVHDSPPTSPGLDPWHAKKSSISNGFCSVGYISRPDITQDDALVSTQLTENKTESLSVSSADDQSQSDEFDNEGVSEITPARYLANAASQSVPVAERKAGLPSNVTSEAGQPGPLEKEEAEPPSISSADQSQPDEDDYYDGRNKITHDRYSDFANAASQPVPAKEPEIGISSYVTSEAGQPVPLEKEEAPSISSADQSQPNEDDYYDGRNKITHDRYSDFANAASQPVPAKKPETCISSYVTCEAGQPLPLEKTEGSCSSYVTCEASQPMALEKTEGGCSSYLTCEAGQPMALEKAEGGCSSYVTCETGQPLPLEKAEGGCSSYVTCEAGQPLPLEKAEGGCSSYVTCEADSTSVLGKQPTSPVAGRGTVV